MMEDIKSDMYPTSPRDSEDCCCKDELDKLCCDKTVKDLRSMGRYLMDCADKMSSEMEKSVTVDDFEARMKDTSDEIPTIDNEQDEE